METSVDPTLIEHIQLLAQCDISKDDLTDSIAYFRDMLLQFNLINADPLRKFNTCAKKVAGKLFENFVKMLGKCTLVEETEYFFLDKTPENVVEVTTSTHDEEYKPPEKIRNVCRVPFDIKLKIVMTANEHPHWSFKVLQQRFKTHLRHNSEVARFKNEILSGGTFMDKMDAIKRNVYDRFTEARACKQLVTRQQLQQWAMAAAVQFRKEDSSKSEEECAFRFVASPRWMTNFMNTTIFSTLFLSESTYVPIFSSDTSPGLFGVRVKQEVDELLNMCKNVIVVCQKSGKLTSSLYKQYLITVLKPYVGNNPFLIIVDSWGGKKNIHMYNENFKNDENKPTFNLQIIPPKCTPICQPCDVYFYKQVKIIIKRIQNCPDTFVGGEKIELNSRYDAIKIQSLTHYLLSAPLFKNMIQFAWYASKLANEREIFCNVNQLCFPPNIHNTKSSCKSNYSFIKCSWCTSYLCFQCFYNNFHPQHCTAMSDFYNK
ncbi:uncharacterized protein [Temnothorax longispinosus]|uniref:uncharacterized protein n=1 Tax=Temnothorax longispinosus TaxID=300112 RepID=UPI003A992CE0